MSITAVLSVDRSPAAIKQGKLQRRLLQNIRELKNIARRSAATPLSPYQRKRFELLLLHLIPDDLKRLQRLYNEVPDQTIMAGYNLLFQEFMEKETHILRGYE